MIRQSMQATLHPRRGSVAVTDAAFSHRPTSVRCHKGPDCHAARLAAQLAIGALGLGILARSGPWAVGISPNRPACSPLRSFAPLPTLERLWDMAQRGEIWEMSAPSLNRVGWGLGIAILVGVPMGILIGRLAWLARFVECAVPVVADDLSTQLDADCDHGFRHLGRCDHLF